MISDLCRHLVRRWHSSCSVQFSGSTIMPLLFVVFFFLINISLMFIPSYEGLKNKDKFWCRLWMLPCYTMRLTLGKEMQEDRSLTVMFRRRMFCSLHCKHHTITIYECIFHQFCRDHKPEWPFIPISWWKKWISMRISQQQSY